MQVNYYWASQSVPSVTESAAVVVDAVVAAAVAVAVAAA